MVSKPPFEAQEDWPLPRRAYVPGRGERPGDEEEFRRIARAAPCPTDPAAWRDNSAWIAGLRLYRHGYFWEAHEAWEAVWMHARPNSAERALLQGVIQLANAGLKQRMERPRAARRLAGMAVSHIEEAMAGGGAGGLMGLDLTSLRAAARRYRTELVTNEGATPPELRIAD